MDLAVWVVAPTDRRCLRFTAKCAAWWEVEQSSQRFYVELVSGLAREQPLWFAGSLAEIGLSKSPPTRQSH